MLDQNQNQNTNPSSSSPENSDSVGHLADTPLEKGGSLDSPIVKASRMDIVIQPPDQKIEPPAEKTEPVAEISLPEKKDTGGLLDIPAVSVPEPIATKPENNLIKESSPVLEKKPAPAMSEVFNAEIVSNGIGNKPLPDENITPAESSDTPIQMPGQSISNWQNKTVVMRSVILILTIGILGVGGFFGYNKLIKKQPSEKNAASENSLNAVSLEQSNKKDEAKSHDDVRQTDLKNIAQALKKYYNEHQKYPLAKDISKTLIDDKFLLEVPADPLDGQPTAVDQYVYKYAVYKTAKGEQTAFILSAISETNKDPITITESTTVPDHLDFRDLSANVAILEPMKAEVKTTPKPKVKRK